MNKKTRTTALIFFLVFFLGGEVMALTLKTPAFDHGGMIPKKYTCDGGDVSPELFWSGVPQGTKSFALIMDDPDAPPGTWVHWVLFDLPADSKGLAEGIPKTAELENGSRQGLCWGVNDFTRTGYYGPCPPPGNPHRYYFKLYALDAKMGISSSATKGELEKTMQGHVLATTELVGRYGR